MTTTDVANLIRTLATSGTLRNYIGRYGAVVFSAAVHASVLLVMAYCVLPLGTSTSLNLNAVFDTGHGDASGELVMQESVVLDLPAITVETSSSIAETEIELPDLDVALIRPDLPTASKPPSPATSTASPGETADSSGAASSVEEAVDRVTGTIQGKLQAGDMLVVWLMDASYSWLDDRQRMIGRLDSFLKALGRGAAPQHRLLNTVVSFGSSMRERLAPTDSRTLVLNSLAQLPVDASGRENVFSAIERCAARYRGNWPDKQLMIVVWTDESGDDARKLENTIRICRDYRISVSVVGPSAVLGADTGLHSVQSPRSRQVRLSPIKRGPDSALPERLELDYWFLTQEPSTDFGEQQGFRGTELPSWYGGPNPAVPDHRCLAATEIPLPTWYGGRDLRGLISGFSPHALTRLARQTGGTYIIFDRDEDLAPFSANAMWAYRPDYRSIESYLGDVQSNPIRRAVMEAVKVTQNKEMGPPPTMLFGTWSETPPYGFMRNYIPPAKFAGKFRMMRRWLKAQADRSSRNVEEALAHVSQPGAIDEGLEQEYVSEKSPRWRAWYDLTRGRLLATSVRLEEYRLVCDAVAQPGSLNATTNHVIFVPLLEMRSDSSFRRRAEEAERLLVRCVRENPNTPWAWLAQRELNYGLGINVRQYAIGHVVMASTDPRQPDAPQF